MSRSKICFCVFFMVLASCGGGNSGGGNSGGGSSGGGSSGYQGVRAVDLTCLDGQFWGECVLTWEDGGRQKVCNWTIFGCQQVGTKKGQIVRSVEYYDKFGNLSCYKLFEGGWIEDCYNPSQWFPPSDETSEPGDTAAPGYTAAPQSTTAIGGEQVDVATTTIAPPPPELNVGSPSTKNTYVGDIYNRFKGSEVEVMAYLPFELPISFANNKIESICVSSPDASVIAYLANQNEYKNWDNLQSNCTNMAFVLETLEFVKTSEYFQIHVALGRYVDGKQGFVNECFASGYQEICKEFDFVVTVKSSNSGQISKKVRLSIQFDRRAISYVLLK